MSGLARTASRVALLSRRVIPNAKAESPPEILPRRSLLIFDYLNCIEPSISMGKRQDCDLIAPSLAVVTATSPISTMTWLIRTPVLLEQFSAKTWQT